MLVWRQGHIQDFLHELIRHEGLGEHRRCATCVTCREDIHIPPSLSSTEDILNTTSGPIRCQDCHGDFVECATCCLKRHELLPLHRTQVSNYSDA